MYDVFKKIEDKIGKTIIPPRILLSKFRFIDESSRYSRECLDPSYLPFYYYLGKYIPCENLLEIGFGLGLNASCYFTGCKGVKHYLSVQEPVLGYYSSRIGIANIKQVYKNEFYVHSGKMHDEVFVDKLRGKKWDMAIVSEKRDYDAHMFYLNTLWDNVKLDGMIFMDYVESHDGCKRAYKDFCLIKKRDSYIFPTRYGVGVIII